MMTREHDPRLDILNTLLSTPHRQLMPLWPVHEKLREQDPLFYMHLAAWYFNKGEVRDHKEMFVINLVLSAFPGHRDVGLALLRQLPPFQVARVVDFIAGRKVKKAVAPVRGRKSKKMVEGEATTAVLEDVGLFRALPRSLRTEVIRYLREREAKADRFDRTVLTARKSMKRLYALLHVRPGERAQKVLFDNDPPADSQLYTLKVLARATNPQEQAAAIVANRIPYRVAASVVREMTPDVVRALVETMTPMELINNVASLKKRGALEDEGVRALVEEKLQAAKTDNRVSAFKAEVAVEAAGVQGDLEQSLREVTEARVRSRGEITRATAMLLDRSGSMTVALEVGKQLGALISAVTKAPLYAHVFDTSAHEVKPKGPTLADWEKAMAGISAGGGTSIGVAIQALRKAKQLVEQIVIVTDEGENTSPMFADAYAEYVKEMALAPEVVILRVGSATNQIEKVCKAKGIPVNVFTFKGDYYSLPNVLPLLAGGSRADLLLEIIDYPLPTRQTA